MIVSPLNKILFLDIETVPLANSLMELDARLMDCWVNRSEKEHGKDADHTETFINEASYYAEFSKVACISFGYLKQAEDKSWVFTSKSFCGDVEPAILADFSRVLEKSLSLNLCGHNILSFDVPFLCKRYLINRLVLPNKIDYSGKKPWEITDIDTMNLWKFGSFSGKNISLELLSASLGIESPKIDMDGSKVKEAFKSKQFESIVKYCEGDVKCVAQVTMKLMGLEPIK